MLFHRPTFLEITFKAPPIGDQELSISLTEKQQHNPLQLTPIWAITTSPHGSEQWLHTHSCRTLFISHGLELHAPGCPLHTYSAARPRALVRDPGIERASALQSSPPILRTHSDWSCALGRAVSFLQIIILRSNLKGIIKIK